MDEKSLGNGFSSIRRLSAIAMPDDMKPVELLKGEMDENSLGNGVDCLQPQGLMTCNL